MDSIMLLREEAALLRDSAQGWRERGQELIAKNEEDEAAQWEAVADEMKELRAKAKELGGFLRELEWISSTTISPYLDDQSQSCPCCGGLMPTEWARATADPSEHTIGHRGDCRLTTLLRVSASPTPPQEPA